MMENAEKDVGRGINLIGRQGYHAGASGNETEPPEIGFGRQTTPARHDLRDAHHEKNNAGDNFGEPDPVRIAEYLELGKSEKG